MMNPSNETDLANLALEQRIKNIRQGALAWMIGSAVFTLIFLILACFSISNSFAMTEFTMQFRVPEFPYDLAQSLNYVRTTHNMINQLMNQSYSHICKSNIKHFQIDQIAIK
jgi:hypothetical protein